jgi:hypothetical protein
MYRHCQWISSIDVHVGSSGTDDRLGAGASTGAGATSGTDTAMAAGDGIDDGGSRAGGGRVNGVAGLVLARPSLVAK